MNITKYGHACLIVATEETTLIIDPGELTELPDVLSNVVGVIVTHAHADHLSQSNLQKIRDDSPDFVLYGVQEVIEKCEDIVAKKQVIDADTALQVGDIDISLYYLDHEIIYQTSPCKNLAVKVDDQLYYPGDSFHVIPDHVRTVAVPLSAPWLKSSESIEFAKAMNADVAFPTHNGLLNDAGHSVMNNWIIKGLEGNPTTCKFVKSGEEV
ncbi:MAG: MBL fold metallo-hydrolase [Candidatus Saccharibacteria bacterium]|nr:MBL fold metallo-hydrolase [Candidatus Saccharibacteria bacterium]